MAVFSGNGSAASPSFTFSSDTNSGMYRFGADQLGFAVGATNMATLTSTGLGVGSIGISWTPVATIQARYIDNVAYSSSAFNVTGASISNDGSTLGQPGVLQLTSAAYTSAIQLSCVNESPSSYSGAFTVKQQTGAGTAATERLRIDSAGDVKIGGTLPSSPNTTISASGGITTLGGINSYTNSSGYVPGATVSVTVAAGESIQYVLFSSRHPGASFVSLEYGVLTFGANSGVYQYTALVDDPNQTVSVTYGGAGTATVTVTGNAAPTSNVLYLALQRFR